MCGGLLCYSFMVTHRRGLIWLLPGMFECCVFTHSPGLSVLLLPGLKHLGLETHRLRTDKISLFLSVLVRSWCFIFPLRGAKWIAQIFVFNAGSSRGKEESMRTLITIQIEWIILAAQQNLSQTFHQRPLYPETTVSYGAKAKHYHSFPFSCHLFGLSPPNNSFHAVWYFTLSSVFFFLSFFSFLYDKQSYFLSPPIACKSYFFISFIHDKQSYLLFYTNSMQVISMQRLTVHCRQGAAGIPPSSSHCFFSHKTKWKPKFSSTVVRFRHRMSPTPSEINQELVNRKWSGIFQ